MAARRLRPSLIDEWPTPFDPRYELDWSRPDYSRRLLREHLDQSHDGASRRRAVVERQVRRLRALLPPAPARVLDAACGPGLYALPLARAGHRVTGADVSPAALRHARAAAREQGVRARFIRADLRHLAVSGAPFDAALLIYYVLEAFPRREQPAVLRSVARCLAPGGIAIVEMRLRPDQLPGRVEWWEVTSHSVLADRRHLLLGDTTYDARRNLYVLREIAVFDDGRVAAQQTSAWLCPFDRIRGLFARAGLQVTAIHDRWTASRGTALSESVLVVARRNGPRQAGTMARVQKRGATPHAAVP
ncbi:MAG: class I SAM-dependent methyltransferase [Candidatus Dormibacteraeota bacterium]|nr:class I SAM-dependent methyltransferase [Candidatus Dormibacteraeota bacterium]MBV9526473.1 class I SAM-dependent methyltransferase [Candidatus Dormibacteraeota bacterium]